MRRSLYMTTLLILQLALVVKLAPPLAHGLGIDAAPGLAPGGWPAMLQLVATAVAVAGASVALVFPGIALACHRRCGLVHFLVQPRWAIAVALFGAAALVAGALVVTVVPTLPVDVRMTAALIARPVIACGLALATAGVLCAELLRGEPAPDHAEARERSGTARVEVTHPPDLRTRVT
jgi:hypothetical protein